MHSLGITADQSQRRPHAVSAQVRIFCIVAIWLVSLGYGFTALIHYDAKQGEFGKPAASWPVNDTILSPTDHAQLVMFVDPKCSCTRAALAELLTTLGRTTSRCEKCFVLPGSVDAQLDRTATQYREMIQQVPNAKLYEDNDRQLAGKFGVRTSGHILLYGPSGKLIFSGGITKARAHEGDNAGRQLLEERLNDLGRGYAEYPVFGCCFVEPRTRSPQEVSR